jgi:hypothetical protein
VASGANLVAGDLPGHTHTATDIVSGELPHKVQKDGADVGTRRALNLVQGTRVSLAIVNNAYTAYLAGPTQITLTTFMAAVQDHRHAGKRPDRPVDRGSTVRGQRR